MTLRSASQAAAAKHKWQFTCLKDSDLVMLQEKKGEDFHGEKKKKASSFDMRLADAESKMFSRSLPL